MAISIKCLSTEYMYINLFHCMFWLCCFVANDILAKYYSDNISWARVLHKFTTMITQYDISTCWFHSRDLFKYVARTLYIYIVFIK